MRLFTSNKKANDEITPAETQHIDAEKGADLGHAHEKNSDAESLSSNAQAGVKAVEAAASVWSKHSLWGAYAMYVVLFHGVLFHGDFDMLMKLKHLVDLLRDRSPRGRCPCDEPLRRQCFPSALPYCCHRYHVFYHWRLVQDPAG